MKKHCALGPFFLLSVAAFGISDIQRKIKGVEKAHDDAFHANLLKQIAPNNDTVSHPSSSLDLEVSKSFASFATNATNNLTIYTSDSLPTNPAPSSACGTAMAAVIPCNSTIPLMAYDVVFFFRIMC